MLVVEVRDFQSISSSTFTIDGFTALTGRSNIGKSAAMRALKCALTAAEGSDFVRHDPSTCSRLLKGSKKCQCYSSVLITFDNDRKLLWEKGDAINQYTSWVNGDKQVYSRVGRNPELPEILRGFEPIRIGDRSKELVQVSDQFNPIFLLDVPGPTVADVLSDVAQLDDVNIALKLVVKDRKEATATLKVRESDIKRITSDLESYATLPVVLSNYADLELKIKELDLIETTNAKLDSWLMTYSRDHSLISSLTSVLGKVNLPEADPLRADLGETSQLHAWSTSYHQLMVNLDRLSLCLESGIPEGNLVEVRDTYSRLEAWDKSFDRIGSSAQKLQRATVHEIPDRGPLRSKTLEINQVVSLFYSLVQKSQAFSRVSKVASVAEIPAAPLSKKLDSLVSLAKFQARLSRAQVSLVSSDSEILNKGVQDLTPVSTALRHYETSFRYMAQLSAVSSSLTTVEEDLTASRGDLDALAASFSALGVCPTCSQLLTPSHTLSLC